MTRRLVQPLGVRLKDEDAERVRRNHDDRLAGLEERLAPVVVSDVALANATNVRVTHNIGRRPKMVKISPPRGGSSTGRIQEVRDGTNDRDNTIVLIATGWGATITVDVEVY